VPVVVVYCVAVAFGVWYLFVGHSEIFGGSGLWQFGDENSSLVAASTVMTHGGVTHLYSMQSMLVAFPGSLYVIGLILGLLRNAGAGPLSFRLSVSHGHFVGMREVGTSWYVCLAVVTAIGLLSIIPLDRLARQLGARGRARIAALIFSGVTMTWLCVQWGHPDDAAAIGCLALATEFALQRRWRAVGWALGTGLAVQPLIILAIPTLIALAPARRWFAITWRAATVPVAVTLPPLIGAFRYTVRQVVEQPAQWLPTMSTNHRTPWFLIAPHISYGSITAAEKASVSGGVSRFLAVLLALTVGVWVVRRRGTVSPTEVVGLVSATLSLRLIFETVVIPYYLAPIAVFAVVAVSTAPARRIATAIALSMLSLWMLSQSFGPWTYWFAMTACLLALGAVVMLTARGRPKSAVTDEPARVPALAVNPLSARAPVGV
jgi:hypothetical protein